MAAAALGASLPVTESTLAFSSTIASYDAAYAKAVGVIASDIVDGRFIAGEDWAEVWTRDTAYSIDLGVGQNGTPMTYLHDGKQYIVVAIGSTDYPAELVALALP